MSDPKSHDLKATDRKPYDPPVILFEHPTEALAGNCDGTSNCPSKQASTGVCDTFDACTSHNS